MNSYLEYVVELERLTGAAATLPLGGLAPLPRPEARPGAGKVMLFSPHPDDECITGLLPLRLMRESGMAVVNVAVTQGSNKARQAGRLAELREACAFLGWEVLQTAPGGLERINPSTRAQDVAHWGGCVEVIAGILRETRPEVIVFPHGADGNTSHEGVHLLVLDALGQCPDAYAPYLVETEFWRPMADPNVMVEADAAVLADLVAATSFHKGEVARNPYHVLLPAWMQDNVRRGAEHVGTQGGGAPTFKFATLYRLRRWSSAGPADVLAQGRFVSLGEVAGSLFS